ncbi:MAG: polyphosphate kinase 2, partial [Bauldia sp.]|nr:polyphosphate kinase 2 [Bauldia sp.]
WYNRAGVEPVMGFCTAEEHRSFLEAVPGFEKLLVDQGIILLKFWLNIGQATQLKRFFERRHDPLKIWKLSPIDYKAMHKWDDYTRARDEMFAATHRPATPWSVVRANDKRRARLNIIRHVLATLDYPGRDANVVRQPDPLILGGPGLLDET